MKRIIPLILALAVVFSSAAFKDVIVANAWAVASPITFINVYSNYENPNEDFNFVNETGEKDLLPLVKLRNASSEIVDNFGGWYYKDQKITKIGYDGRYYLVNDKNEKIEFEGLIEIKAKYTAVSANPPSIKGYRITYKGVPKGVKNPNPRVTYKTYKLKSLKRKGYIFKGWYSGKKKITKISNDITVTAKWKKQ